MAQFFDGIGDLNSIEYFQQILKSLALIAGYSVHTLLKVFDSYQMCTGDLTFDKEFPPDTDLLAHFKLLLLTDRGQLKCTSEHVLTADLTLWKIIVLIEEILSDRGYLWTIHLEYISGVHVDTHGIDVNIQLRNILRQLIFTTVNCFLVNKITPLLL